MKFNYQRRIFRNEHVRFVFIILAFERFKRVDHLEPEMTTSNSTKETKKEEGNYKSYEFSRGNARNKK